MCAYFNHPTFYSQIKYNFFVRISFVRSMGVVLCCKCTIMNTVDPTNYERCISCIEMSLSSYWTGNFTCCQFNIDIKFPFCNILSLCICNYHCILNLSMIPVLMKKMYTKIKVSIYKLPSF